MRELLNFFLDSIIPNNCLVCERILGSTEHFCPWCLPEIYAKNTNLFCRACFCALGSQQREQLCAACLHQQLPYRQIRFLWNYDFEARRFINKMKYKNSEELCKIAGELLALHFDQLYPNYSCDLILPMPSSKLSDSKRLYYPCGILAGKVKQVLRHSLIDYTSLQYKSEHTPQALLSDRERLRNARNSCLIEKSTIQGKTILLIEDVITTGASIYSASKALLDAGAISIDILALARVSRWQMNRNLC